MREKKADIPVDSNGSSYMAQILNRFEEAHGVVNGATLQLRPGMYAEIASEIRNWNEANSEPGKRPVRYTSKEIHQWLKDNSEYAGDEADWDTISEEALVNFASMIARYEEASGLEAWHIINLKEDDFAFYAEQIHEWTEREDDEDTYGVEELLDWFEHMEPAGDAQ